MVIPLSAYPGLHESLCLSRASHVCPYHLGTKSAGMELVCLHLCLVHYWAQSPGRRWILTNAVLILAAKTPAISRISISNSLQGKCSSSVRWKLTGPWGQLWFLIPDSSSWDSGHRSHSLGCIWSQWMSVTQSENLRSTPQVVLGVQGLPSFPLGKTEALLLHPSCHPLSPSLSPRTSCSPLPPGDLEKPGRVAECPAVSATALTYIIWGKQKLCPREQPNLGIFSVIWFWSWLLILLPWHLISSSIVIIPLWYIHYYYHC